MKEAIITVGYPLTQKELFYKDNYSSFQFIDYDKMSYQLLKVDTECQLGDQLYIVGFYPSYSKRKILIDSLIEKGYSVSCLWFNLDICGVLYYLSLLGDETERKNIDSQIYTYKKHFQEPKAQERFSSIKKIIYKPTITYGKNKSLFISLGNSLVKINSGKIFPENINDFTIIDLHPSNVIKKYKEDGYKIILYFGGYSKVHFENSSIYGLCKNIANKMHFEFDEIVADEVKQSILVPSPCGFDRVAQNLKIDLSNSALIGNSIVDKTLADIISCKYYFSKDIFFYVQNYAKNYMKENANG